MKPLTSAVLTAQSEVLGASIEVLSDVNGPFRWGIGAKVTSESPDSAKGAGASVQAQQSATVDRLLQNGGLIHLSAAYPVIYLGNESGDLAFSVIARGAIAGDTPRLNEVGDIKSAAGTYDLDAHVQTLKSAQNILGLEGGASLQGFFLNDTYAATLAAPSAGVPHHFTVAGVRAGIVLFRRTRIGFYAPVSHPHSLDGIIRGMVYVQQTN